MNIDSLMEMLPSSQEFNEMVPSMKRQTAESFVDAIMQAIEREGRQPDAWESGQLIAAISCMGLRCYSEAVGAAVYALVPVEERSDDPRYALYSQPLSIRQLRDELVKVIALLARGT